MDIFSYWDSGRETAPKAVQKCLDRWEALNPEHRLIVLDASDLGDLLSDLPFDVGLLPVQARADILRIRLLRLHGGAWVDATLLPLLPLDAWHETYRGAAGFFVFSGPPEHWRLSNFLIFAQPGNYYIQALDEAVKNYWTHPRRLYDVGLRPTWAVGKRLTLRALITRDMGLDYLKFHRKWHENLLYPVSVEGRASQFFPYFWQQYLMMQLANTDPEAGKIVDAMTYRHHDLCHSLQNARQTLGDDFTKAVPIALRCSPVQKLDWRVDWPDEIFAVPDARGILI